MRKKAIIFVDDDEDDRKFLIESIKSIDKQIECIEVENGSELMKLLKGEKFEAPVLVLMDMNMPVMNGLETISAIRHDADFEKLNVVMLSTSSDPDMIRKAREAGITEFVVKPWNFEDYTVIMQKLILNYF